MGKKNKQKQSHQPAKPSLLDKFMGRDEELLAAKKVENKVMKFRNGGMSHGAARQAVSLEFKISLQEVDELLNLIRVAEKRTMI